MIEDIALFFGELFFWREDYSFSKRKKARRALEKEQNLPKKLMISPIVIVIGVLLLIVVVLKLVSSSYFNPNKGINKTSEKITKIELLLEKRKSTLGEYPIELKAITKNNPLKKRSILDYWNNKFHYKVIDKDSSYILISKGKDGILNTEDDILSTKFKH